jgi:manganese/zinc/iron transport system permease protein
MVLSAAGLFALALFFGPRHGIVSRWWRHRSRSARIRRENTLKAIYHELEGGDFVTEHVALQSLAERRRETLEDARRQIAALRSHGEVTVSGDGETVSLTPAGWQRACEIVRNHRLWELYLTNEAQVASDHVHEDAEIIEHVLGEASVLQLEKKLNYARRDPHGKLIPGLNDIRRGHAAGPTERATGFGSTAS